MAIRDIVWTVAEDAGSITPNAPQNGGVQGEHNASRVVFQIGEESPLTNPDYQLYIECIDAAGGYDKTEPLTITGGQVSALVPLAWTQYGGTTSVRLVAEMADQIVYALEGWLVFESRQTAGQKVDGLLRTFIQTTLDGAQAAQAEAEKQAAQAGTEASYASDAAFMASTQADAAKQYRDEANSAAAAASIQREGAARFAEQAAAGASEAETARDEALVAKEAADQSAAAAAASETTAAEHVTQAQTAQQGAAAAAEKAAASAGEAQATKDETVLVKEAAAKSAVAAAASETKAAEHVTQAQTARKGAESAAEEAAASAVVAEAAAVRAEETAARVAALDDEQVSGATTWSSQNTVDRLCEAFSETADSVPCHPVEDYPLTVEARGKNLIPYPFANTTKTTNGITFTDNGDGSITVNGTATAQTQFVLIARAGRYSGDLTISGCPEGGSAKTYRLVMAAYDQDNNHLSSVVDIGNGSTRNLQDVKLHCYIDILSGTTVNNVTFKPQIELGTTATAYEPYRERVTVTRCGKNLIPYPYDDTTKTTNGITFTDNGDGSITVNGTATDTAFFEFVRAAKEAYKEVGIQAGNTYTLSINDPSVTVRCLFAGVQSYVADSTLTVTEDMLQTMTNFTCDIRIPAEQTFDNVTVYPQLELGTSATEYEPYRGETFTVDTDTVATIPALSGVNTLYADSGKVTVTGREDPRYTVGRLETRITALEAAVVSHV